MLESNCRLRWNCLTSTVWNYWLWKFNIYILLYLLSYHLKLMMFSEDKVLFAWWFMGSSTGCTFVCYWQSMKSRQSIKYLNILCNTLSRVMFICICFIMRCSKICRSLAKLLNFTKEFYDQLSNYNHISEDSVPYDHRCILWAL